MELTSVVCFVGALLPLLISSVEGSTITLNRLKTQQKGSMLARAVLFIVITVLLVYCRLLIWDCFHPSFFISHKIKTFNLTICF